MTAYHAPDPHHEGQFWWKYERGELYQKSLSSGSWEKVKRVSFTPKRILLLAELVRKGGDHDGNALPEVWED